MPLRIRVTQIAMQGFASKLAPTGGNGQRWRVTSPSPCPSPMEGREDSYPRRTACPCGLATSRLYPAPLVERATYKTSSTRGRRWT